MKIEVWSDVACPWCWVGKKHLEKALADFDTETEVTWRAFELNPQAPATSSEPVDYAARLAAKYRMDRRDAQAFIDRMTEAGRQAGIVFRFDRIRPCNTFKAHQLLAWADSLGHQDALKERLFLAYMNEGHDLNNTTTLGALAAEAGLDTDQAVAVLANGDYADHVRADQGRARELGITGVPFFVLGPGIAASGAQPPDVLLRALSRARDLQSAD